MKPFRIAVIGAEAGGAGGGQGRANGCIGEPFLLAYILERLGIRKSVLVISTLQCPELIIDVTNTGLDYETP